MSTSSKAKSETLIRKQVLITREQDRRLKALAAASGIAVAEVVREGIDLALEKRADDGDDWREQLGRVAGLWSDHADIERAVADGRRRRAARRARMTARVEAK
jgi:signal transduction protein with GAF and PtsI domain